MSRRVVFDTITVVSALLFANGRLAWLRQHWRADGCTPVLSRATAAELTRVLAYPKFRLSQDERRELLAEYLPYCEVIEKVVEGCKLVCRDVNDQPFLDLAQCGKAELLVSGIKTCWRWPVKRIFLSRRRNHIVGASVLKFRAPFPLCFPSALSNLIRELLHATVMKITMTAYLKR
jgi:putative PIN family toxin of toxin-antitoxin system